MTPIGGAPTNLSASQMQSGGPLGLPPGLSGRMPPGAAFGFVSPSPFSDPLDYPPFRFNPGAFSSPEAMAAAAAFGALGPHHGNPFGQAEMAQARAMTAQHQHDPQMAQAQAQARLKQLLPLHKGNNNMARTIIIINCSIKRIHSSRQAIAKAI